MKNKSPKISIIVPTLNEEPNIALLLTYLQEKSSAENVREILVVDGGSTDDTVEIASDFGAIVLHSGKGRAKQMNYGARRAKGEILYFLHADTFPPEDFDRFVLKSVGQGYEAGCFQMKFDTTSRFLSFFSWFSKINHKICRGGDQSLYVTKRIFKNTGGFNEDYMVYEDTEFIGRLYQTIDFKVLPQRVVTSARKYRQKGAVKLQFHFGVIHLKNILGAGPEELYEYYQRKIAV
ncbi:MAG: TIGR04283 family arsenosugar biosynthesis glycosyltransferase [Pricia sp.]